MPNLFPYTNTQELNLDWILQVVKDFQTKYNNFDQAVTDALAAIEAAKTGSLEDMQTALTNALAAINAAISGIGAAEQSALQAIAADQASAQAAIAADQTAAQSAIATDQATAQAAIAADQTAAQSAIATDQATAQAAIAADQTAALLAMQTALSAALSTLNNEQTAATYAIQTLYNTLPADSHDILGLFQIILGMLNNNYSTSLPWLQCYYTGTDGIQRYNDNTYLSNDETRTNGCASRRMIFSTAPGYHLYELSWWSLNQNPPPTEIRHAITFPANTTYYDHTFDGSAICFSITVRKDDLSVITQQDVAGNINITVLMNAVNVPSMIAFEEADLTADIAHTVGTPSEYFLYNGALYRALENIPQNGTIVLSGAGANCEETTVCTEINNNSEEVINLKSEITDYEINFSNATQIPALINSSGEYSPGVGRITVQISAQGIAYLSIKANPSYQCEYAFLASTMEGLSQGDSIPFVEGETGKRTLQSGAEMVIKVPAGCNYITFLKTYGGNTYLPTYAVALKASSPAINKGLGLKKCGVIGHSGPYGTRLSNRRGAWPYIAADILAIPNVNNVAVGGSTIAKQEDSYEEIYFSLADFETAEKDTTKKYLVMDAPTDAHPFMIYQYSNDAWAAEYSSHNAVNGARAPVVDVVHSLDADVDIIMIGAGANDYTYAWTPFGAVNDTPTKYTFCGAVHLLLQYIIATYPGVPVSFSDAIIWDQSLYTTANSIGKTYLDYLNAMKEIARMYKIPYVDFDAISSFPYPSDDATWYAEDEKHMSKKGHKRVGQVVAAQIKSILG